MLPEPIITIDVHGMTVEKALEVIHKNVNGAGSAVFVVWQMINRWKRESFI